VPIYLHTDDCWVLEYRSPLPRVYVPRRVEVISDRQDRLTALGSEDFDGHDRAFVEQPLDVPAEARGSGSVVDEVPMRVTVSARMETPGLLVLADQWYPGWHAYHNGTAVPLLRVNHALRGVVLPAGEGTVVFEYWPATLTR